MYIYLYDEQVSGTTAELHFIDWCLRLENEHNPVPHNALDAMHCFQEGAYNYNMEKREILKHAGIEIRDAGWRIKKQHSMTGAESIADAAARGLI